MDEYGVDLREIRRVIDTAEVMIVRFALVEKRLLVDLRQNALDGPMIKLVPRAQSLEDRVRSLKQLRPRFELPDKIMSFWWPRHVQSLETSGVWEHLSRRLTELGDPRIMEEARAVYEMLAQEERDEMVRAIRGEGYQSLWEQPA